MSEDKEVKTKLWFQCPECFEGLSNNLSEGPTGCYACGYRFNIEIKDDAYYAVHIGPYED